jgi:nucleoside-diphosphate-sugar epimerase
MKILVTGSTGFIGNHLIKYLLSKNHEVIATSRDISKAQKYIWYKKVLYLSFDIENIDESVNLYEKFHNPDVLIHLAWDGVPNFLDAIHIEKNLFSHYKFLKNYIINGGKQVVCIGTCLEYGLENGCLSEENIPKPDCAYAVAKDSLRRFIENLQKDNDFIFQWVRLFYMYGKGQNPKSILSQLELAVKDKNLVFNMSLGEQLRDYLPVEIVAVNIGKIALQKKVIGIINCSAGIPTSVRTLVENFISKNKYSIKLNLGFYPYPLYEPMAFWGNNQKLKTISNE